jgi:hypothetical protein
VNRGLNAHQPVARLPADILLSIPTYFDFDVIQFDLVNLTHVFRYWRETFISASFLWSTIHMQALHVPLLMLSLERSGSAPIKMHISRNDNHRFAAVVAPIATARQNEYNTLCLDGMEWDQVVAVSQLTSNSVSHLRVLSLNVTATDSDHTASAHPIFPRALALQELTLRLISTDTEVLDCLRFTNLTVLSLFCTASISQSKALELLRVSPRLKRVELDFRRLTTDPISCPPAVLRELRELRVEATTSEDSHLQFFENLICPVAEDVIVSVQPVYFGRLEASPFQSSWGFLPRSSKVHTLGLQVRQSPIETTYSVGLLYGETSRFEISFRFVSFGTSFASSNPREFSVFPELLHSLRALGLNGVTRLSVTGIGPSAIPPSIKSDVFSSIRELLTDAENLEILTISSGCLPVVRQALTPRPTPPIVLCPRLDSIELLLPAGKDSQKSFAELMVVCKARATAGYPLRDISLRSQVSNSDQSTGPYR